MSVLHAHGDGHLGDDPFAVWDAAYVLGSLEPQERRQYEEHLKSCPRCREGVAELSGIPSLLALLDRDEVADLDEGVPELPPVSSGVLDGLLTKVNAKVSSRHKTRRALTWTMAAAAAAIIAVLVGIHPGSSVPPTAPKQSASGLTMTPVAPNSMTATVDLISQGPATRVEMSCSYPKEADNSDEDKDEDDKLAMVVVGRDGSHTQVATWVAESGVTAHPAGTVPKPIDQIAAVQVVTADNGNVLLQRNL